MSPFDPLPPPEYSDPKELWAYFGLATYRSQVLERGILNLIVLREYLDKRSKVDPDLYERIYTELESRTLGPNVKRAIEHPDVPAELGVKLRRALEQRNYLIHRFFWIHSEDLLTEPGRKVAIDELQGLAQFFADTDGDLNKISTLLFIRHGGSLDDLEAEMEKIEQLARKSWR